MKRILFFVICIVVLISSVEAEEKIGLNVGDIAPDFTATTHGGDKIQLADALSRGPVVLVFYRGGWCKYCNLQLQELQGNLNEVTGRGASLIAISVDLQEKAAETVKEKMLDFTIVSNPEADLLKAYNLVFHVPEDLAKKYKEEYKIDLEGASGRKDRLISIPAVYIIDTDKRIRYAHANKDYKVRPSIQEIIDGLDGLNEKQVEENAIELSLCSDEALGISFYCNGNWGLETSEDTLFIVIKEKDPSITVTITKTDTPVLSMKLLTPAVLKELGNYREGFSTTVVQVDGKDAIQIDGFANGHPEVQLRDYYVIHDLELYAVLFAFSPKEQWDEYKSLSMIIMKNFRFNQSKVSVMPDDGA